MFSFLLKVNNVLVPILELSIAALVFLALILAVLFFCAYLAKEIGLKLKKYYRYAAIARFYWANQEEAEDWIQQTNWEKAKEYLEKFKEEHNKRR